MIHEFDTTRRGREDWIEVRDERASQRVRWERRAAQWRALELARHLFGESVSVRLDAFPSRGAFAGLVHLEVPFGHLEDHRRREHDFLALAGADELLTRVPLVFVFEPDPSTSPATEGGF